LKNNPEYAVKLFKEGYNCSQAVLGAYCDDELIQKLAQRFKEKNGSIICRELLVLDIHHDSPTPEARTESHYKKRPCVELVKCAAEIIDEVMGT